MRPDNISGKLAASVIAVGTFLAGGAVVGLLRMNTAQGMMRVEIDNVKAEIVKHESEDLQARKEIHDTLVMMAKDVRQTAIDVAKLAGRNSR